MTTIDLDYKFAGIFWGILGLLFVVCVIGVTRTLPPETKTTLNDTCERYTADPNSSGDRCVSYWLRKIAEKK